MLIAIWPITALYFDGRNHNNKTGQESFFSLAHIVLYTGMSVFAIFLGLTLAKYQARAGARPLRGIVDLKAIPVGYGVAFIGLCILASPGRGTSSGTRSTASRSTSRRSSARRTSALFFGGLLVSSTGHPLDVGQARPRARLPRLPAGAHLGVAVHRDAGLHHDVPSAWMTNVPPTTAFVDDLKNNFHDVISNQHIGLTEGLRGYGDNLFPYHYYTVGHGPSGRSSSRRSCCSARRC